MKTDCPSFEEFEKLFKEQFENEEGDVAVPEKPEHKVEWSRCCDVSFPNHLLLSFHYYYYYKIFS